MNDLYRWLQRDFLMAELDVCCPDFQGGYNAEPAPPTTKPFGELVVATALEEWGHNVHEPRGTPNRIDRYIRGAFGLDWSTADAINWAPDTPYTRDGMFQWCGAFAAHCWGTAGIKASIRKKKLASTARLRSWGRGTERMVTVPDDLRPGDIVVVSRGKKRQGEHICIVEHVNHAAKLVHTIEGNAKGLGPDGTVFEGVIKRTRPWPRANGGLGRRSGQTCPVSGLRQSAEIVGAYRPLPEDFA